MRYPLEKEKKKGLELLGFCFFLLFFCCCCFGFSGGRQGEGLKFMEELGNIATSYIKGNLTLSQCFD